MTVSSTAIKSRLRCLRNKVTEEQLKTGEENFLRA